MCLLPLLFFINGIWQWQYIHRQLDPNDDLTLKVFSDEKLATRESGAVVAKRSAGCGANV
jgi:hypothetical protein